MRVGKERWFATLLTQPRGATLFIHEQFPEAQFFLEKRTVRDEKMIRNIRFELKGRVILRARAEVDIAKTNPKIVRLLRETQLPLGEIVKKFHVRRTRLKSTSRSRAFHFLGDIHAKIWERFYTIPPKPETRE